jgi:hypothetical protein
MTASFAWLSCLRCRMRWQNRARFAACIRAFNKWHVKLQVIEQQHCIRERGA